MTDFQLKCFLTIVETKSFSKAAKNLFISQSNISRQIQTLEEELGYPLFDRTNRGVQLTASARIIADELTTIMTAWNNCIEQARKAAKHYVESLSIGCTIHVESRGYLSKLTMHFQEMNPTIRIFKERNSQKKLVNGLMNGQYDAILTTKSDILELKNVESITLFYSQLGIVLHKSHPLFLKKEVHLIDLKEDTFIRYLKTHEPIEEDYVLRLCLKLGFEPKIAVEFDDFEEYLSAIEAGEGVALVHEKSEVEKNVNLRFIPITEDIAEKYIEMSITRKKNNKLKALDKFFTYAKIEVAKPTLQRLNY